MTNVDAPAWTPCGCFDATRTGGLFSGRIDDHQPAATSVTTGVGDRPHSVEAAPTHCHHLTEACSAETVALMLFDPPALESQRTIALNDAHMFWGGTPRVVRRPGDRLRSYVQVNCYLSYDASGFGAHWDDHDVVVIQLAGRKHWEVHEPTELGALSAFTPPGATKRSIWSGLLTPGTALFIPRGWPHSVAGLDDEPSVHLTLSNRRMNGIDVLGMTDDDVVAEPELLDLAAINSARATWCAQIPTRPVGGPFDLIAARKAGFADHQIRLTMPGGCILSEDTSAPDRLALVANGRLLEIDRAATDGLCHLLTHQWTSTEDLPSTASTRSRSTASSMPWQRRVSAPASHR